MSTYQKSKKIMIVVATIFVVMLIAHVLAFFYFQNKIIETVELNNSINQTVNQNFSLFSTKKQIEELKNKEALIDKLFLDKKEVVSFIENVEKMGVDSGVELTVENVGFKEDQKPTPTIDLSIRAQGSLQQTIGLLDKIENIPQYTKFLAMKLEKTTNGKSEYWVLNLSLMNFVN